MNRFSLIILLAALSSAGLPSDCPGFDRPGMPAPAISSLRGAPLNESGNQAGGEKPLRVEIKHTGAAFRMYRGGKPYSIKGIGGRDFLETAAAAGANSLRTWGSQGAGALLDRAQGLNLTVMLGIWLSHRPSDYEDQSYKNSKINEIENLLARHKNHPALLAWSLGNEINLEGADSRTAWRFVNDLAGLIKKQDADHPVITVIACNQATLNNIAVFAPDLDAVGINAYGALTSLRSTVEHSAYKGAYLITEWGIDGHWETEHTAWGRPIEPTSAQKAEYHLVRYARDILANSDRCIGSYVFLWGQKQERTPTWYSMFLEDLPFSKAGSVSSPAVDVMHFNWTGAWPPNQAPHVVRMTINDVSADSNIILSPGEPMISRVDAGDPDSDPLCYIWELLEEPVVLGTGGAYEPRPRTIASTRQDNSPVINLRAPLAAGEYRLFVYVLDNNGHAGTANIPFQVRAHPDQEARAALRPSEPG